MKKKNILVNVNNQFTGLVVAKEVGNTIDLSEKGAFTSSKKYEIKVIARDMLGNEMNKTLSFLVKDQ
jgi:hypothetical protein